MENKANISIIIPVYNAGDYIEQAVKSVVIQVEVGEILLIEDGSKDNSLEICKKLVQEYKNVRLVQHENGMNKGAGATRNKGIVESKYPFVAFLDADDYYLENRFVHDLELLINNPDADGVYSAIGTRFYDQDGQTRYLNEGMTEQNLTTMKNKVKPEHLFEKMEPIGEDGFFHCNGLLVHRHVFDKTGLFDVELELSQDTFMWLKMALICRLIPGDLKNPVAMRGVHSSNRVADKDKLIRFRRILYKKLYQWAKNNQISKERLEIIWLKLYYTEVDACNLNFFFFNLKHLLSYPEALLFKQFRQKMLSKFLPF